MELDVLKDYYRYVPIIQSICVHVSLTPQYLLSLNICGGRGFPVAGLDSSGTFSLIHFLLASLAAMSHSSNSILLAARKPITSCCCFLICVRRGTEGKLSVRHVLTSASQGNIRASVHHTVISLLLWDITLQRSLAALLLSYHLSFFHKSMKW